MNLNDNPMCVPCFIYAYVIKRDSKVLVKGLSYDKKKLVSST